MNIVRPGHVHAVVRHLVAGASESAEARLSEFVAEADGIMAVGWSGRGRHRRLALGLERHPGVATSSPAADLVRAA